MEIKTLMLKKKNKKRKFRYTVWAKMDLNLSTLFGCKTLNRRQIHRHNSKTCFLTWDAVSAISKRIYLQKTIVASAVKVLNINQEARDRSTLC